MVLENEDRDRLESLEEEVLSSETESMIGESDEPKLEVYTVKLGGQDVTVCSGFEYKAPKWIIKKSSKPSKSYFKRLFKFYYDHKRPEL